MTHSEENMLNTTQVHIIKSKEASQIQLNYIKNLGEPDYPVWTVAKGRIKYSEMAEKITWEE